MKEQFQIFLAHAVEDKNRVRELYTKLKSLGFKPWLDEMDLIPGQNWRDAIEGAIRESDVFIACLSSWSVQKQGYVQKEFRFALNIYAEKPQGSIFLMPVKLDDCEVPDLQISELGVGLRDIHWVDLWRQGGFERLVEAINNAVNITNSTLSDRDRAGAYSADTSPDVTSILPEPFEWCHIPAGTTRVLSTWHQNELAWHHYEDDYIDYDREDDYVEYRVEDFYISKYPITNEQFLTFASSPHGYNNAQWWKGLEYYYDGAEGWPDAHRDFSGREKLTPANVWRFDAIAFCRWLAYELMHTITVPHEVHWQRAAQGDDGRKYPWGDNFDPMRCNSGLSGIGRLTPVTKYANGASPYNVFDLSGNMWEWCVLRSADSTDDTFRRFFQSGAFHTRNASFEEDDPELFRCAYRGSGPAPYPDRLACFRPCVPSSIFAIE